MTISITTKDGKCAKHLCTTIDTINLVVIARVNDLVFNFEGVDNWTFVTGINCEFKTGNNCTFNTGFYCTFKTGRACTFHTGYHCNFKTGDTCSFKTGSECTFNVGRNCSLIRFDVYGVVKLPFNVKIMLNSHGDKGYLYNTQDWCENKKMSDEETVMMVLKYGGLFDPTSLNDDIMVKQCTL